MYIYINVDQVFLHELLHAFGIAHMQTRSDRDKYVFVNFKNIPNNTHHNFDLCSDCRYRESFNLE